MSEYYFFLVRFDLKIDYCSISVMKTISRLWRGATYRLNIQLLHANSADFV